MWNYIKKLLSESTEISSNRVMFILWNIYIMIFCVVFVSLDKFTETIAVFLGGVIAIIWGGKVTQKYMEKKRGRDEYFD